MMCVKNNLEEYPQRRLDAEARHFDRALAKEAKKGSALYGVFALRKEVCMMDEKELLKLALTARERAYVPYSGFAVGAALLCADGKIYLGCNIENAAYTPSNCAERTAFFKAVSEGERDFAAIAIVGGKQGEPPHALCPPCGVCRQVMMEFCDPATFRVILGKNLQEYETYTLKQILPMGFGPGNLKA